MIAKTKAGATFFTTQLLFEPTAIERVLDEYSHGCAEKKIRPAALFLSLAPVCSQYDIEFFKWLGAEMPAGIERKLRKNADPAPASIIAAIDLFSEVSNFERDKGLKLEVSPNIEAISNANLDLACSMADSISRLSK
jgi:5,10-methylenetetrahydrofolate reductase